MSNEAAERLKAEIGVAYRIELLDEAIAYERRATVKAIRDAVQRIPWQNPGPDGKMVAARIHAVILTILREVEILATPY